MGQTDFNNGRLVCNTLLNCFHMFIMACSKISSHLQGHDFHKKTYNISFLKYHNYIIKIHVRARMAYIDNSRFKRRVPSGLHGMSLSENELSYCPKSPLSRKIHTYRQICLGCILQWISLHPIWKSYTRY